MAPRVLVVEDAEPIRTAVGIALGEAGHEVCTRADGDALERELAAFRPDLVLLDVMLPGRDGFELLAVTRETSNAGVILLTARDGVEDRLHGLRTGADDYVVKPFVLAELIARAEAVLRRMGRLRTVLEIGDLLVDVEAGSAARAGEPLELTATEYKLLVFLAGRAGKVVGKLQLLTAVWGYDDYAPNLVEVHISALRRKLGPDLLHTVRGAGYVLKAADG
ncbi:response regulator transcription factor [Kribbella sandramycini]|uniref:DNA-binding response OmpR family regulator n=1 Tax=Kribbella sandramycini TaxID=60450 RepID=A0A7Y4NWY6_9ACTN|nr:response regulator transcription factor [Kribbella sandramycini]MBB6568089.1 DNA-binding response OmpR family regulator [Kribbella sandramycini]NOL39317.1 response regulator transcription factor [Kribbella sandramycini]